LLPSSKCDVFVHDFISALFQGYLALVGGLATTWYVVFTYYLMRSTIELNQQAVIPYLGKDWNERDRCPENVVNNPYVFKTAGAEPAAEGGGARWVVLVLTNIHDKAIARVDFKINITGESDGMLEAPKPPEIRFSSRLKIEKGVPVEIGVAEVSLLPSDIKLTFHLKEISYMAIDLPRKLRQADGPDTFPVTGSATIVPGKR
jgi:hypothetical protein